MFIGVRLYKTGPKKAFTLVELLVVLIVIGVTAGLVYSVFVSNNSAINNYMTRADLWYEADQIIDNATIEARHASAFSIINNNKRVLFQNDKGE